MEKSGDEFPSLSLQHYFRERALAESDAAWERTYDGFMLWQLHNEKQTRNFPSDTNLLWKEHAGCSARSVRVKFWVLLKNFPLVRMRWKSWIFRVDEKSANLIKSAWWECVWFSRSESGEKFLSSWTDFQSKVFSGSEDGMKWKVLE